MLKKTLKIAAFILAAIAVVSVVNPFLAYRVSRYDPVDFGDYYEYSGVIGIHTTFSDGSGSYQEIGRICDSLNLHFAIITDKNTVKPLRENFAKRSGMTLMIPAVEISGGRGDGSYIVIGDSIPLLPAAGVGTDSVLGDAARKGSLIILSHASRSVESGTSGNAHAYPFAGMELYNFDRGWKSMLTVTQINKLFGAYIDYVMDPRTMNYLIEYPRKQVDEFDRLNKSRKVFCIGTAGASSNIEIGKRIKWNFPSYESVFNLVHTVIVTATPYSAVYQHDREVTIDALRSGHAYVAFSGLEPARGFFFTAKSGNNKAIMGDSLLLDKSATIDITLPDSVDVETRLFRSGKLIHTYSDSGTTTLTVDKPGEYRVEVFQKRIMFPFFMERNYPWIISNPIYIHD